ncbi:alpha/beta fold hydrolase [Agrococcus casei]|uniref:alpha/beta fold hydrolase n=2 Tax=Agrococcus casei TaxID=343512 RepID=UPI003F908D0E
MTSFEVIRSDTAVTANDGTELYKYVWEPGRFAGQVLLLHGFGEHALRYEHVAQFLVHNGYRVIAYDQRGHGATGLRQWSGDFGRLGKLGPGGQRAVVADAKTMLESMREEHPDAPLGLVAHSWGSLTAQTLINDDAKLADAAVLTGTAWRRFGKMNSGDLNKRHAHLGTTGGEWLTRDEEMVAAWLADPLTIEVSVLKLLGPIESLKLLGRPARELSQDLPLLIASGSDDAIGEPSSLQQLGDDYRNRSGLTDVTVKVFPGARHEILNETNRVEVLAYIETWLTDRLGLSQV